MAENDKLVHISNIPLAIGRASGLHLSATEPGRDRPAIMRSAALTEAGEVREPMSAEVQPQAAPIVSVVMPVYNGEAYLADAIASVLGQTFSAFELVVVDDCSTDGTAAILDGLADPRIRRLRNDENRGIVVTLNRGFAAARGRYIARMDADDLCEPERLQRQAAFLDSHPDVLLVGTRVEFIGSDGASLARGIELPAEDRAIRLQSCFVPAFVHPTVMIRAEVLRDRRLEYVDAYRYAEDYELWVRIMALGRVANLPEKLLRYRVHGGQTTTQKAATMAAISARVSKDYLRHEFGLSLTEDEIVTTCRVLYRQRSESRWDPRGYGIALGVVTRLFLGVQKAGRLDGAALGFFARLYARIGRAALRGATGRAPA